MISNSHKNYDSSVSSDLAEPGLSQRLLDLRVKIQQQDYLDNAILRIAQVISKKIVENPEELSFADRKMRAAKI